MSQHLENADNAMTAITIGSAAVPGAAVHVHGAAGGAVLLHELHGCQERVLGRGAGGGGAATQASLSVVVF